MFKKAIICLVTLAVIVGASVFLHVYYIYEGGDGTLFWKADTAYLFLNLGSLGYRMTYLQFIGQTAKELLGVGREPSDERYSNVVFTINPAIVHRYVLDDSRLSGYFVIDGSVLSGDIDTGILWRWDENHFERATAQDQSDLTKAGESHMPGPDYDDVDGWHKRVDIFSRQSEYTYVVNLNGVPLSLMARRENLDDLSLDLLRPDGTKETIWHLNGRPRMVSKSEYQHVFAKN